jgi:hypothetical protein
MDVYPGRDRVHQASDELYYRRYGAALFLTLRSRPHTVVSKCSRTH